MLVRGFVSGYDGETLTICVPFKDSDLLQQQGITECEVRLVDITPAQRRKIFAMVRDIADWATWAKDKRQYQEELRRLQLLYLIDTTDSEAVRKQLEYHYCELLDINLFSLSNCDVSTARDFISYLAVEHNIPCRDSLLNRCEDIERYLYACVANRRCAICGKKADIHEVERVGMGRDRRQIHHLGQLVQPLCRQHHAEVDQIGQASFDKKYHITGIRLDENLCKKLRWRV